MEPKHLFLDEWLIRALIGSHPITPEIVERYRVSKKASLAEAALEEGLLTTKTLASIILETYRITMIDLSVEDIDKMSLSLVPEKVCRRRQLLPFQIKSDNLLLAMSNPLDMEALGDVQSFSGRTPIPYFCLPTKLNGLFSLIYSPEFYLQDLLNRLEKPMDMQGDSLIDDGELEGESDKEGDSTVIRLVNLIIKKAITMGASDIHIEHEDTRSLVRFRIDGLLKNILVLPKELGVGPVVARIKILSNMDIADHFRPQDGRAMFRFKNAEIGFRVSMLPTNNGEKVVMRLLDKRAAEVPFQTLGFRPELGDRLSNSIKAEQGIVLVTGPTGSGKTTTLYSILNKLKAEHTNITTVEDPIEYKLEGINQVQVNEKQGLTFPTVLRSVLRQDPDIIFIGEIRDLETAKIAIQAAMTGHLVFSTLHTNDAMSTIERLRDIGIEPYKIASCLLAVTAQRLVRKLCTHCSETIPQDQFDPYIRSSLDEEGFKLNLTKGTGCKNCHFTGYKGQIPLLELWDLDSEAKKIIATGDIKASLHQYALGNHTLQPLWRDALWHLSEGHTTLKEINPFLTCPQNVTTEIKTTLPVKEESLSARIMIVDDDQTIRQVYRSILENEGYQITLAQNGLEAVNLLVKEKFDLVLLDLMMPEMGGLEVVKSVRQVMGLTDLPIIVLTGVSDEKTKKDVLSLGADDYLTKPSSPATVIGRVKSILMRKKESGIKTFPDSFSMAA